MKCLCLSTSAGWEVGKVRSGVKGGFLFFYNPFGSDERKRSQIFFFFSLVHRFLFFSTMHHDTSFFFLYNNGISFTIILVEVEVRTLNVMWQYIEIGALACPHHRTLSTSCGSQLGYLHPCGSGVRIGATLTRAVAASAYNACRHAGAGQMWAGHAARSFRRVFLQRLVKYFALLLLKKSWNQTSNCNFFIL